MYYFRSIGKVFSENHLFILNSRAILDNISTSTGLSSSIVDDLVITKLSTTKNIGTQHINVRKNKKSVERNKKVSLIT